MRRDYRAETADGQILITHSSCVNKQTLDFNDADYRDVSQRQENITLLIKRRKRNSEIAKASRRISSSLDWCSVYNLEITPDAVNNFGRAAGMLNIFSYIYTCVCVRVCACACVCVCVCGCVCLCV